MKLLRNQPKPVRILIVVLSVLLILSICALAARALWLYFAPSQSTVTVPGNQIGSHEAGAPSASTASGGGTASQTASDSASAGSYTAPLLEFYQGHAEDNQPLEVRNMVPGDAITRYYCIKAYHKQFVTLHMEEIVTQQTKQLGDVLHIRITELNSGVVVCDDFMNNVDQLSFATPVPENAQGESTFYYKIDVSMDTSVGNEYQRAMLKATFRWYIEGEDAEHLTPPPRTGDTANIMLWVVVGASAAALFVLLLLFTRRKEENRG